MKSPTGKLMVVVAVAAVNFVLIRGVLLPAGGNPLRSGRGGLVVLGAMPMADLIALGWTLRGPGRRFLERAPAWGGVALGLFLGLVAIAPATVLGLLIEVVDACIAPGRRGMGAELGRSILAGALLLAPQLLIAAIGGAWITRPRGPVADAEGLRGPIA